MYWILYGLYVLLGLIGCAFLWFTDHMESNKDYFKVRNNSRPYHVYKPFRLSRRSLFIILCLSVFLGPLVFVIGFAIFMCSWISTDWTGFWSKPVCNCFEPKKEGKSNV